VDFELLLELKIEQKHGTSLHTASCTGRVKDENSRASVRPSELFQYQHIILAGTSHGRSNQVSRMNELLIEALSYR
jgi:hypothetical protein